MATSCPATQQHWYAQETSSNTGDSGQKSSGQSSQRTIPYTGVPSHEYGDSVSPATPPQRADLPTPAPMIPCSSGTATPAEQDPLLVLPGVAVPGGTQHVLASVQARAAPAQQAAAVQEPFMSWRSGQHAPAFNLEESLPQRSSRGPRSSHGSGSQKAPTRLTRPAPPRLHVEHNLAPRPHQKAPQTEQHAHASDLLTTDGVPGAVVFPKVTTVADMGSSQLDAQKDVQLNVMGKTTADTKQGSSAGILERTQPAEKEMRYKKKGAHKTHQQEVPAHPKLSPGDGIVSGPAGPAAPSKGDDRKMQRRRSSVQQLGRQSTPARSKAVTMHADSPIHGVVLPERPKSAPSLPKGAVAGDIRNVPQQQKDQHTDMSKHDDSQSRMTASLPKAEDGTSGELVPQKTTASSGNVDLASELSGSTPMPNDVSPLKESFDLAAEPKIGAWRPRGGAAEDAASGFSGPQPGQGNTAAVVWEPAKQPPWVRLENCKSPVNGSQAHQADEPSNSVNKTSPSTADAMAELKPLHAQDGSDSDPGSSTSQVYIRAGDFPSSMHKCSGTITAVASFAAHYPKPLLVLSAASTLEPLAGRMPSALQPRDALHMQQFSVGSADGLLPLHSKVSKPLDGSMYWIRVDGNPHPDTGHSVVAGQQVLGVPDALANTPDRYGTMAELPSARPTNCWKFQYIIMHMHNHQVKRWGMSGAVWAGILQMHGMA